MHTVVRLFFKYIYWVQSANILKVLIKANYKIALLTIPVAKWENDALLSGNTALSFFPHSIPRAQHYYIHCHKDHKRAE